MMQRWLLVAILLGAVGLQSCLRMAQAQDSRPLATIRDRSEFETRFREIDSPQLRAIANHVLDREASLVSSGKKLSFDIPPWLLEGGMENLKARPIYMQSYVASQVLWQMPTIQTCWENPQDQPSEFRQAVRDAVESSWQAVSKLRFTEWDTCSPDLLGQGQQIRILLADTEAKTIGLGREISGKPGGMILNLSFQNWNTECITDRAYCIKAVTVHEFGHAVGLAHEQNRPDTITIAGEDCAKKAQGQYGDLATLTPWDKESVMNYCNRTLNSFNHDGKLSAGDIKTVQSLYGAP